MPLAGDIFTHADGATAGDVAALGPVILEHSLAVGTADGGTDGNVTFTDTVNASAAGGQSLRIVAGAGTIDAQDDIGTRPDGKLAWADFSGATIHLHDVATAGTQLYTAASLITTSSDYTSEGSAIAFAGPVTLNDNMTVDTTRGTGNGAGANIDFQGTLDADTAFAHTLDLTAGTGGDVAFQGDVGGTALGAVTIHSAHNVDADAPFTAASFAHNTSGTGDVTFDSTLTTRGAAGTAGGNVSITTAGTVTISNTLDAQGGADDSGSGGNNGGAVALAGSTVEVDAINTSGSAARIGSGGAGGGAGRVSMTATHGTAAQITLNDDVISLGGAGDGLGSGGPDGTVTLTSQNDGGGVTQAGGCLAAANLLLLGAGTFVLDQAGNDVDTVAADLHPGSLSLADADDIEVGSVDGVDGIAAGNGGGAGDVTVNAMSGTITVNRPIATTPGAGGMVSLTGSVVVHAGLIAGGGGIELNGSTADTSDIVVESDITSSGTIDFEAPRDILVGAALKTTGGTADILLAADSETAPDGVGGVQVQTAGQVDSARRVTVTGSDLWATGAGTADPHDSVDVQADGTAVQVKAVENIQLKDGDHAPTRADTLINGVVQATGSGSTITITAEQDVQFGIFGDVTSNDGNISITADTGSGNDGVILMADNGAGNSTVVNAGNGTIALDAAGNITLGSLQTGNTTSLAVTINSSAGGVIDGGDTAVDIVAAHGTAVIGAVSGVGSANAIDTTLGTLDLDNTTSGNVAINESDSVNINRLVQAGSNGTVTVTAGGTTTIVDGQDGVTAVNGQVDLDANGIDSSILVNDAVASTGGAISVTADNDVSFDATSSITSTTGTVTVTADADNAANNGGTFRGEIAMAEGSQIDAGSGLVDLSAYDGIALSSVTTTSEVQATATGGAITDNTMAEAANIAAATAALRAYTGIGDGVASDPADIDTVLKTLAAETESGDINIHNVGSLVLGTVNGLNNVRIADAAGADNQSDHITIRTASPLTVNVPVMNNMGGNITLAAEGNTVSDDLTINANTTVTGGDTVVDGDGTIELYAGHTVSLALAAVTVSTDQAGTILLSAGSDYAGGSPVDGNSSGDVGMTDGSTVSSESGDITVLAPNDVLLSLVNADADAAGAAGDLVIIADYAGPIASGAGNLYDSNNVGQITDNLTGEAANLTGDLATLHSADGIGAAEDINTSIATLDATNGDAGDIRIQEVAAGGPITINRLAQADSTESGNILLQADAGTITVAAGQSGVSTAGSGNVLLEAVGNTSDVVIGFGVSATNGAVTISAGNDVDQEANVTATGGSIYITAANAATNGGAADGVNMASGTNTTSGGGNIRLEAANEGDIRLALINAGSGDVSMLAQSNVLDNDLGSAVNVQAANLRIEADTNNDSQGQIGTADGANGPTVNNNAIDIEVTTVAASSADGIYLRENDGDLNVGTVAPVSVSRVDFDATTHAVTDPASLIGLATDDAGPIKTVVSSGSLTVSNVVTAGSSGDVLLEARGAGSDVVVNADVVSGSGHVSILSADDDVHLNADVTTSGGSIHISAPNKNFEGVGSDGIIMSSPASMSSGGGNVLLEAGGESDILLGLIDAGGSVSLLAEGDILDNNGAAANVQAPRLRMVADSDGGGAGRIGTEAKAVDTDVTTLAASSGEGTNVRELDTTSADGLTVDEIPAAAVQVQQVTFSSTETTVANASLSDLEATAAGPIKVFTPGGLLLNDGGDADASSVVSHGGSISLSASQDVVLAADVRTTGGAKAGAGAVEGVVLVDAGRNIEVGPGVTAATGTGFMTHDPPPVTVTLVPVDQGGSNVTSLGHAIIEVTVDDTGSNYQILVDWGDGTINTYRPDASFAGGNDFVSGKTYRFDHYYFGNPDPLNPAAPIPVKVTVRYDGRADAAGNPVNGIVFREAGQILSTTVKDKLTVPGEGLFAFVKVEKVEIVPVEFRKSTRGYVIVSQASSAAEQSNLSIIERPEIEGTVATQLRVLFRRVDAAGKEGDDVDLPIEVLEGMLEEVFRKFPNGYYRVYLQEAGSERVRWVRDVHVYKGRVVTSDFRENVSERQPGGSHETAPNSQSPETGPGGSKDAPAKPPADEKTASAASDRPAMDTGGESGAPGGAVKAGAAIGAGLGAYALRGHWADQVDRALEAGPRSLSTAARLCRRIRRKRTKR